jgi:hypothetical protein
VSKAALGSVSDGAAMQIILVGALDLHRGDLADA